MMDMFSYLTHDLLIHLVKDTPKPPVYAFRVKGAYEKVSDTTKVYEIYRNHPDSAVPEEWRLLAGGKA